VAETAAGSAALDELLPFLKRELKRPGAVAVHANRHTDFVAAVGAAHLHHVREIDPAEGLRRAQEAGLSVTSEARALLGVDQVQPRSAIAAATSSGRSVTT
jgi:hypothetical protein